MTFHTYFFNSKALNLMLRACYINRKKGKFNDRVYFDGKYMRTVEEYPQINVDFFIPIEENSFLTQIVSKKKTLT